MSEYAFAETTSQEAPGEATERPPRRDPVEALEEKIAIIKKRIRSIKAKERAAKQKQERLAYERKAYLVGNHLIQKAATSPSTRGYYERLLKDLRPSLKKDFDRALFGFRPLPKTNENQEETVFPFVSEQPEDNSFPL
jgi:hypothetical protein